MRKLRCPNDLTGCYALCVTDNVVHQAGDLYISKYPGDDYSEQEMLTSEEFGVWA